MIKEMKKMSDEDILYAAEIVFEGEDIIDIKHNKNDTNEIILRQRLYLT